MIQSNKQAKIVGLTGGISSGKSTVSNILRQLGAKIIDADELSKQLMQKGKPLLDDVVEHFGEDMLLADGNLNRKKMADLIFSSDSHRRLLNRLSHPRIIEDIKQKLQSAKAMNKYELIILDCALLFELDLDVLVEQSWLVYVPEEIQISRLMMRDKITKEQAVERIKSQMPLEQKIKRADIVIDNSMEIENTKQQIVDLCIHD